MLFAVLLTLLLMVTAAPAHAWDMHIPAANTKDMVYDAGRDRLYIAGGDRVLTYDLSSETFGAPIVLGGELWCIDLSPDGSTLVVTDSSYSLITNRNWIHLIDVESGTTSRVEFPLVPLESGTHAAAFGSDGSILVTTKFRGSGWVPLRRYVPSTQTTTNVAGIIGGTIRQNTMLTASADRGTIAFAESNISDGRWGRYRVSDGHVQHMTGYTYGTGGGNFDIAVNANGTRYAIPVSVLKLYGADLLQTGSLPFGAKGVAYAPDTGLLYAARAGTSIIGAYDPATATLVREHDIGYPIESGVLRVGRLEAASDGSALFCVVQGGVVCLALPTGTIDGHVFSDEGHTQPFAGLGVTVVSNSTGRTRKGVCDADGYFRVSGLPDSAEGYTVISDAHDYNVAHDTDFVGGVLADTVAPGDSIEGHCADVGGRISGTVVDALTDTPLKDIVVAAEWDGHRLAWGASETDGTYVIRGVAVETDVRVAFDPSKVNATASFPYFTEYWDDAYGPGDATLVQAGASGISAGMDTKDFIAGRVFRDEAKTVPFEGLRVVAVDNATGAWRDQLTDANGSFRIAGLQGGAQGYRVLFDTTELNAVHDTDYVGRWYSDTGESDAAPRAVPVDTTIEDSWLHEGGRITGTVRDSVTHAGLKDFLIGADWGANGHAWAASASDGTYVVRGVDTEAEVRMVFDPSLINQTAELPYLLEYWQDSETAEGATLVRAGTTGLDADVGTSDYIDGHVYLDSAMTVPFSGLRVLVIDNATEEWYQGFSNDEGYFRIGGLADAAEGYTVFYDTHDYNEAHDTDYLGGLYYDSAHPEVIPAVVQRNTTLERDWFQTGGRISGTVRDGTTGAPLADVLVGADWGTSGHAWGITGPDGRYVVRGVPAGRDIRVEFDPSIVNDAAEMPYLPEWWNNARTPGKATLVRAGATGIDATLDPMFALIEDTDPRWQFSGAWTTWGSPALSGGTYRFTNSAGARAVLRYTGGDMYLFGRVGPEFGVAKVYVDGTFLGYLDYYDSSTYYQEPLCWTGPLTYGPHEIAIEWTGYADPDAWNSYINIDVALVDLTPDLVPPAAPTGLTATGGPRVVTLAWEAVGDADTYRVYRGSEFVAETKEAKYAATGLAVSSAYTYTVTAVDRDLNESQPSKSASATTWPEDIRIEQNAASFRYTGGTWNTFSNPALSGGSYTYSNTGGAISTVTFHGTQFALFARTGPEFGTIRMQIDGKLPAVDISLWSKTTRYQQPVYISEVLPDGPHSVSLVNAGAIGTYINIDAMGVMATPDITPPSAPTGLAADSAGPSTIGLVWNPVTWNALPDAALYRVYTSEGTLVAETTDTQYQVTGLAELTDYGFKVTAVDAAGNESVPAGPVNATTTKTLRRIEQDDPRLSLVGGWSTYASGGLSGGSYTYSNTPGTGTVIEFFGTRLDLLARKGPEFGIMTVSLDGAPAVDVDLYHPSTLHQARAYRTGALAEGWHTVKLTWTGRKNASATNTYINVDAIELLEAPLQAKRIEQGGAGFDSEGTWALWSHASLSGGAYAYTNASGARTTLSFNGTGFSLVGRTGPEFGIASLSIDGGEPVMVDMYRPTALFQQSVYRSPMLADGFHTVAIVWTGQRNMLSTGTYINVDAIDVVSTPDVTPPAAPTDLMATAVSGFAIDLTWAPVGDAVKYRVYREDMGLVGESTTASYRVAGLRPSTTYGFKLTAVDAAGNESAAAGPASATTNAAAPRIEQDDARLTTQGGWSTWANEALSGGSYAYSNTPGAIQVVEFAGTRLDLVARTGPEFGKLAVSVDGAPTVDVDLFSPATVMQQQVFTTGALDDGWHTVKLSWTGRKSAAATSTYVNVDAFGIVGNPLQAQRLDQSSPSCQLSAGWFTWANGALAGGSYAYTNAVGAKATFTVTGTGFSLVSRTGTEFGKASISIDGGAPIEVDLYRATPGYQTTVFRSGSLPAGPHTVEVTCTGIKHPSATNSYANIDAIDVARAVD